MTRLPENDRFYSYVTQYHQQSTHSESDLEQFTLAMKRFRVVGELFKFFPVSDLKELFRNSQLHKLNKGDIFNLHMHCVDQFYFIVRGGGWTVLSQNVDTITSDEEVNISNIPDWKIIQDPSYINNKIARIIDAIILKQGTRKLVDLTKFLIYVERGLVEIDEQNPTAWNKAKRLMHNSKLPKLELHCGDFFTSKLQCKQIRVLRALVCKQGMCIMEVCASDYTQFVNHILSRARLAELEYVSKINLFSQSSQYEIECIYRQLHIQVYRRGSTIINEGQLADTIYLIKEGEVEIHRRVNKIEQRIRLLPVTSTFGEKDCLLRQNYSWSARVCSAQAVLYSIKYSEYARIFEQDELQKQYNQHKVDNPPISLPILFDQVKLPIKEVITQEIIYRQHQQQGIKYLTPVKKGLSILEKSHIDTSHKSIQIYRKLKPQYKLIDISNPLIDCDIFSYEKQKRRNIKQGQSSSPRKPYNSESLSHRQQMWLIQHSQPMQMPQLRKSFGKRQTQYSPIKAQVGDTYAMQYKQFIASDISSVYYHVDKQ